jgi:Domain of unknown function (DUF1788)
MTTSSAHIERLFDDLFKKFSSQRFLRGEGTAGEIQFYAQTFDPKDQTLVDKQIPHLKKRLSAAGIETLEINLFQLCIELLKEEDILQASLDAESDHTKNEFLEALHSQLRGESSFIESIENKIQQGSFNIVFLTGIGAVYPIIRTHTILNKLQTSIKNIPLVIFFPGSYDNIAFTLFGILPDKGYYRAFNLNDYQI